MKTPAWQFFATLLFLPLLSYSQIDSGYVKTKKPYIFYRIWGEGEPLVFINGGPGFASKGYHSYAEALAKNRQVILYDQRGTGKSVREKFNPPKVYMHQLVDDLERLRQHFNFEKWDVMGHSFGGQVAMYYATKNPERVNKLVLSATPKLDWDPNLDYQAFKSPTFAQMTLAEKQIYYALQEENARKNPDLLYIESLQQALKGRFYVSKPKNYPKAAVWFLNNFNPKPGGYYLMRSRNSELGVRRRLKKFQSPVLIIHGIADFLNISHPLSNKEVLPHAQLEIMEDSGHMMLLDQPEVYIQTINNFLNNSNQNADNR